MNLAALLLENDIDPTIHRVLVMRHRPNEEELRKKLPWFAAEKPELYNAYQQSHYLAVEKQLVQAKYLASFIGLRAKEAVYVGLYKVSSFKRISFRKFWSKQANKELRMNGMKGWVKSKDRPGTLWFELQPTKVLADWKGKLIVDWTAERSWSQWADTNKFRVKSILEESALDRGIPAWDEMIASWSDIAQFPKSWIASLKEKRGIYYIFDSKDGKYYVGSAYGSDNLYGRWTQYSKSGDGGNKLLRNRNPSSFQFSILQLVSPTMDRDEVINLEIKWKKRLHSQNPRTGLNIN